MKKFEIQLDETVVELLEYISVSLSKPIEKVIEDGIYNQTIKIDDAIGKMFQVDGEQEQEAIIIK